MILHYRMGETLPAIHLLIWATEQSSSQAWNPVGFGDS